LFFLSPATRPHGATPPRRSDHYRHVIWSLVRKPGTLTRHVSRRGIPHGDVPPGVRRDPGRVAPGLRSTPTPCASSHSAAERLPTPVRTGVGNAAHSNGSTLKFQFVIARKRTEQAQITLEARPSVPPMATMRKRSTNVRKARTAVIASIGQYTVAHAIDNGTALNCAGCTDYHISTLCDRRRKAVAIDR
jgi:hypothetical protein